MSREEIERWLTHEVQNLLTGLARQIFAITAANEIEVAIQGRLRRSGECDMRIGVKSDKDTSPLDPAHGEKPCKHQEKSDKTCKHEDPSKKPCPHSKETKDTAPKTSDALNDALNKLAEDVDAKNKKE